MKALVIKVFENGKIYTPMTSSFYRQTIYLSNSFWDRCNILCNCTEKQMLFIIFWSLNFAFQFLEKFGKHVVQA